jgi:hypothetical protein
MESKSEEIIGTMTIKEAASLWEDPRREHLEHLAEIVIERLQDLQPFHVLTYQRNRSDQVTASQVDAEIEALLALLKHIGLDNGFEGYYRSLGEQDELTRVDISALPEPIRKYVEKLKREISDLRAGSDRMENQIRRTNWGRSR